MNNKQIGTEFEKQVCAILQQNGWWVHFITPDARGAQPFDVIAVKNGNAIAIDCKTLSAERKHFPLSRLEDNQIFAFDRWMECGNLPPEVWVKHGSVLKKVSYPMLKQLGKVNLEEIDGVQIGD